ncbi:Fibronectin type III domain protein [Verrucomicrobiia bacterium DG1235]|nr:Fibronectin type III domain protein [Verrucomicrobiae bacterium DG1235]
MPLRQLLALSFTTIGLLKCPNIVQANQTVSYEIRRSNSADLSSSTLVGTTSSTHFIDTDAKVQDATYHYFVRASWGTQVDLLIFGKTIPARFFYPSTSSDEVPDLLYHTQESSFSGAFFLLESESTSAPSLIWPENKDLLSETIIEELGTITRAATVDWTANLALINSPAGIEIEWDPFQSFGRNSSIQTLDITRDIPEPTPPSEIVIDSITTPGTIHISWKASLSAASYTIYRSTSDNRQLATKIAENTTAVTYTDSNIIPGEEITILSDAHPGYAFSNWLINDESVQSSNSYTIMIESDTHVEASYELAMPESYINWIDQISPSTINLHLIGPDKDIDRDGLVNYLEYILATDEPTHPSERTDYVALSPIENGNKLAIQFSAIPSLQSGELWVASSTDLKNWQNAQLLFDDQDWTLEGDTAFDMSIESELAISTEGRWEINLTMDSQQQMWIRLFSPLSN